MKYIIMLILAVSPFLSAKAEKEAKKKKNYKFYQLVTGSDPTNERNRWNKKFLTKEYVFGKKPAEFLVENLQVLPRTGKVLDLAMSEGRNGVYMAKLGYEVVGVDYSEVALRKARALAKENGIKIKTINADLNKYKIKEGEYDIILDILYLNRNLIKGIKKGLKPGGFIVFENYTVEHLKKRGGRGIKKEYLLEENELLKAFREFKIIKYSETTHGKEAVARLIAQKPLK